MKWIGAFLVIVAGVFGGLFLYQQYAVHEAKDAVHEASYGPDEVWAVATAKVVEVVGEPLEFRKNEEDDPMTDTRSVKRWEDSWTAAGIYRRKNGNDDCHTFLVKLTDDKVFKGMTLKDADPKLVAQYSDPSGDIYVISN